MEEEEDKDDKKNKMERQYNAAEESEQRRISTSRVEAETSKDTDNNGTQVQGSEVFQLSPETHAQNENGMNDSAPNAGESSVHISADHQGSRAVQKENTKGAVSEDKSGYTNINIVETLKSDGINDKGHRSDVNSQNFKLHPTESFNQNVPVQLQQPQVSEENLLTENLGSHVPETLAREITEHQPQQEVTDKKIVTKIELKHRGSPKKQLKQTALGEVGKKQTPTYERKQEGSRQSQLKKGQKSPQALRQTGKESQHREERERIYNKPQTKKQDLLSPAEVNKMQQKKGASEQTKMQVGHKLKTEEKQMIQAKEGKKQSLFQKEQSVMSKQAETRKIDKREQNISSVQKELQKPPSKKPSVHRKEQAPSSPKKHASLQALPKESQSNLQKKVKQKVDNANVIKNNETKGIGKLQSTEDSSLSAQNQQNPFIPQSTMVHPSKQLQKTPGKSMPKASTGSLLKSEKQNGKELIKECKYEEKVIQKPYVSKQDEGQVQETNTLTEKKSQQEKQNEIKKLKEQTEVNQQLKQLEKEKPQSTDKGNKTLQKFGGNTKARMSQKREESSVPLVINKQASKVGKENQKSVKEKSSENVIHSIRRQYQQLRQEEALQQQQQQLLHQSPHSHQLTEKEEKVQQQKKPEVKTDENKIGTMENMDRSAQKKSEDNEDDKGLGCGGMQGSSCPIYFGVKSYLHHFYDTAPVKNPQLYEEYTEEDDFEYEVDPIKRRGCRKCCQGFWFRAGLWGGINLILVGVITFLVGYLTPQREIVVGQQGDLEILDRSAIVFNHRLELCRLAGLAVFCCGGMVLFIVLFISTLLHVGGHNSNESICCTENIYYGYTNAPVIEPFIVAQAQDLTMPSTTGIKIPIIEQIKSVQPTIWPEMGTVGEGSRVGQMP